MQIEVFMAHVRIDVKNTTGKFIKLCTRRSFEQIFFPSYEYRNSSLLVTEPRKFE